MGLLILLSTLVFGLAHRIFSLLSTYLTTLLQQMNPLQLGYNTTSKWPFTLTFILYNFCYIYGTVIHQYAATGQLINLKDIEANEHLFTHQHVPKTVWIQLDFVYSIDWFFGALLYGLLATWKGRIKDRYLMTSEKGSKNVYIGGKCLPLPVSTGILQLSRRFMRVSIIVQIFSVLITSAIFEINFWLITYANGTTYISIFFFLVLFPYLIYIAFYALFGAVSYVVLASQYIRHRQKPLLAQLTKLNEQLARLNSLPAAKQIPGRRKAIWTQFYLVNVRLVDSCSHFIEYSHYCGPILTIVFPYYITVQCYLLHATIVNDAVPFIYRQLFTIVFTEINMCMFLLIKQCAAVSSYNAAFERLHRQFYIRYYIQSNAVDDVPVGRKRKQQLLRQLKTQTSMRFRRFHSYSFTVWASVRITSKTYFLIISYVSAFFMFNYRKAKI